VANGWLPLQVGLVALDTPYDRSTIRETCGRQL
jgi:hypothetical protein